MAKKTITKLKNKRKKTRRRRNLKGGDTKARVIIWRKDKTKDPNKQEYDYDLLVNDQPKNMRDAFNRSVRSAEYFIQNSFDMKGPIPSNANPYVKELNLMFGKRIPA